jgi:hypothetical protein
MSSRVSTVSTLSLSPAAKARRKTVHSVNTVAVNARQRKLLPPGKYEAWITGASLEGDAQGIVTISFMIACTAIGAARGKIFRVIVDTCDHKGAKQLHQLAHIAGFGDVSQMLANVEKLKGLRLSVTVWRLKHGRGTPLATLFSWIAPGRSNALPAVLDGIVARHLDYELDACHIVQILEAGYVIERGKQVLRFAFEILEGQYFDQPFEARLRVNDAKASIRDKAWEQYRRLACALKLPGIPSPGDFEGKPFRIARIRDCWHYNAPWIEVLDFKCRALDDCDRSNVARLVKLLSPREV